MTHASAPGKIILFGEHAVVYGRPALAVPVTQVHADATVTDSPRPGVWIHAPDVNLHAELASLPADHPIGAAVSSVLARARLSPLPSLDITITSTIPVASGLGSGAAITVALIRALSLALSEVEGSFIFHLSSLEEVNFLAYEIEKLHHGTPSGIDNTVITYAKPVYFIKQLPSPLGGGAGGGVETFTVGHPFTLVIADTGVSAPTKKSVADVRKLWEADKVRWEKVFDQIGEISKEARERISESASQRVGGSGEGSWLAALGGLMDRNHALLRELTVSSAELDRLVAAARRSGASGAKMSGGGRGGNMIALVETSNATAVAEALMSAGAKRTIITEVA